MDGPLCRILVRFRITEEKIGSVAEEIAKGSTPGAGFYALIATASLIASLGLVANSPAVIIGAMLVSPLMSPIFGISLGMIRGDANLLAKAIRAEVSGMVLAVLFGALFGLLPVMIEVTPEMLARTEPTLLDLLVAVFAGFAGTLAMIDDRISPALPGVAIATAIVPPLATCGLCLAAGSTLGASGAFLLFFANFVAILLVSSMTFLAAGLARRHVAKGDVRRVAGNMTVAILGFLLVSAYLTHTLATIIKDRRQDDQVRSILERTLADAPNASLVSVRRKAFGEKIDVLAIVRTPKYFDPQRVEAMQVVLEKDLGQHVRLVVRDMITKDIYPPGAATVVASPSLDGALFTDEVAPDVKRQQLAEQTLREILADRPQMLLIDVDLIHMAGDPVILASVQSPRVLIPEEIHGIEQLLRQRLDDPRLRLLVRSHVSVDVAADGRILFGRAHFGPPDATARAVSDAIRQAMAAFPDMFLTAVDVVRGADGFSARAEIAGTHIISPGEIRDIEVRAGMAAGAPVHLAAWSRSDLMVTDQRYLPVEEYTRQRIRESREAEEKLPPEGGDGAAGNGDGGEKMPPAGGGGELAQPPHPTKRRKRREKGRSDLLFPLGRSGTGRGRRHGRRRGGGLGFARV